jgi:hypothetical protein
MIVFIQIILTRPHIKVNTLAMMKPEKAAMVENHLIQLARTGQLMGKFNEDQLKNLLEKISEQTQKRTVVNVMLLIACCFEIFLNLIRNTFFEIFLVRSQTDRNRFRRRVVSNTFNASKT